MLKKVTILIAGIGILVVATSYVVVRVRGGFLEELEGWVCDGGTELVDFWGYTAECNARLLAFLECLVPFLCLIGGLWLCRLAFQRNHGQPG